MWAHTIQTWGCAKPTQIHVIIIAFQSITFRLVSYAPWWLSKSTIHDGLKLKTAIPPSPTPNVQ